MNNSKPMVRKFTKRQISKNIKLCLEKQRQLKFKEQDQKESIYTRPIQSVVDVDSV